MVLLRPVVDDPEAMAAALAGDVEAVEVVVSGAVPVWLGEAVADAHRRQVTVVARLVPDPGATAAARAGWEIGAAVGVLTAGVDEVEGLDPRRLRRVRAVLAAIDTGRAPT